MGFSLGERSSNRTELSMLAKFCQRQFFQITLLFLASMTLKRKAVTPLPFDILSRECLHRCTTAVVEERDRNITIKYAMLFTPSGNSVMNGAKLVWTGAPWPGVIVPQAAGGAPPGDPKTWSIGARINRTTALMTEHMKASLSWRNMMFCQNRESVISNETKNRTCEEGRTISVKQRD